MGRAMGPFPARVGLVMGSLASALRDAQGGGALKSRANPGTDHPSGVAHRSIPCSSATAIVAAPRTACVAALCAIGLGAF